MPILPPNLDRFSGGRSLSVGLIARVSRMPLSPFPQTISSHPGLVSQASAGLRGVSDAARLAPKAAMDANQVAASLKEGM
jgi:hypothetical protein